MPAIKPEERLTGASVATAGAEVAVLGAAVDVSDPEGREVVSDSVVAADVSGSGVVSGPVEVSDSGVAVEVSGSRVAVEVSGSGEAVVVSGSGRRVVVSGSDCGSA